MLTRIYRHVLPLLLLGAGLLALPQRSSAQVYSGEAAVVTLDVLGLIHVSLSDTGPLPPDGGSGSAELLSATVPGLLHADLLSAHTQGSDSQTTSQASVADVSVHVAGISIAASVLTSNALANCATGVPFTAGGSQIASLSVNGHSITVTGMPNQTVTLLVGSLVINEQISSTTYYQDGVAADMLVNALHLRVNGLADVAISTAHAGVNCASLER